MFQLKGEHKEQLWRETPKPTRLPPETECAFAATTESVTDRLGGLSIDGNREQTSVPGGMQFCSVQLANQIPAQGQKAIWKPKFYGTVCGTTTVEVGEAPAGKSAAQTSGISLGKLFKGNLLESFNVDNSTYAHAQIRATFYPKFENEKTDGEVLYFLFFSLLFHFHFHFSVFKF